MALALVLPHITVISTPQKQLRPHGTMWCFDQLPPSETSFLLLHHTLLRTTAHLCSERRPTSIEEMPIIPMLQETGPCRTLSLAPAHHRRHLLLPLPRRGKCSPPPRQPLRAGSSTLQRVVNLEISAPLAISVKRPPLGLRLARALPPPRVADLVPDVTTMLSPPETILTTLGVILDDNNNAVFIRNNDLTQY